MKDARYFIEAVKFDEWPYWSCDTRFNTPVLPIEKMQKQLSLTERLKRSKTIAVFLIKPKQL